MSETSFLVDYMLGRLARWLLMLGYDTVYVSDGSRPDIDAVDQAAREHRVLLTRDTGIPAVAGVRKLVLKDQKLEGQLRQVFRELGLQPDEARYFSRCTLCNVVTEPVDREAALPRVPPKVREMDTSFFKCPKCGKLYWMGTHVDNTSKKIKELLSA